MKRKIVTILFAGMMAAMFICGCGNTEQVESSGIEATRPTEATEDSTEESTEEKNALEELEGSEVTILPTKFEVFTDGEPHYLMYHADLEYTYWNTFTSLSRPDLGIASVSFPQQFVGCEGKMRVLDENDYISVGEDVSTPIDMTTDSLIEDDGYYVFIPEDGFCGIISREIEMAGEEPTLEEVKAFLEGYYITSYDELFYDVSEEGEKLYSSYCMESAGVNDYYGGYSFRIKDGRAEGAFVMFNGDVYKENAGYVRYMIQSLRFTE